MFGVFLDKTRLRNFCPEGYISRTNVEEEYNFSELVGFLAHNFKTVNISQDFDQPTMVNSAIVCTVRGQVGLFFPQLTVRSLFKKNEFEILQLSICRNLHSLRQVRVPKDWIPEQLILFCL